MLLSKCLICQAKIAEKSNLENDKQASCSGSSIPGRDRTGDDTVSSDDNNLSNDLEPVEKQLHVIFILRNLLEVPKPRLENYLKLYGNPEEWIILCGECSELIENVKKIFVELQNTSRWYEEAKEVVQEKMRNAFHNQFTNLVPEVEANDILKDCRSMVQQWRHRSSKSSYFYGDKLADQLVREAGAREDDNRLSAPISPIQRQIVKVMKKVKDNQAEDKIDFEDTVDEDPLASDDDYKLDAADIEHQIGSADSLEKHEPLKSTYFDGDKLADPDAASNKVNDILFTSMMHRTEEVPRQHQDIQSEDHIDFDDVADEVDPSTFEYDASDDDYKPDAADIEHQGGSDDSFELSDDDKTDVTYQLRDRRKRKGSPQLKSPKPIKKAKHVKIKEPREVLGGKRKSPRRSTQPRSSQRKKESEQIKNKKKPDLSPDDDGLFHCDNCSKQFSTYKSLMCHKRSQHLSTDRTYRKKRGPFPCDICKTSFKSKLSVRRHLQKVKRKCHICSKEEESDCDLVCHLSKDHGENVRLFPCTVEGCSNILSSKYGLQKHLRRHAAIPKKCNLCDKMFKTLQGLKFHQFIIHKIGDTFGDRPFYECPDCQYRSFKKDAEPMHQRTCPKKTLFKCEVCANIFPSRKQLSIHQDKQHSIKPTELVQGESEDGMEEAGYEDQFPCSKCGKLFFSEHSLLKHEKVIHHDAGRFTCKFPSCSYGASARSVLAKHEAVVHKIGIEDYKCDNCQYLCQSRAEKSRHICGAPEKRYWKTHVCTTCGREFNKRYILQAHILSAHENKFKFNCHLCGNYGTNMKPQFSLHMASKHEIGDFKCEEEGCTRVFHLKKNLEDHVKYLHRKEPRPRSICPICGKTISNCYSLAAHIKGVHSESELKPYKCAWCGKGFKTTNYRCGHKRKCRVRKESLRLGQS